MRLEYKAKTPMMCLSYKCKWRGAIEGCIVELEEYRCPKCNTMVEEDKKIIIRKFNANLLCRIIQRHWITMIKGGGWTSDTLNELLRDLTEED